MRDIISDNHLILMVMTRFGISLGFGDKSVEEICAETNTDTDTFIAVANFISGKPYSLEKVDVASLIDYLKRAHSYFLDFNLPHIRREIIESIDCSGRDQVAMLILKFFDEYVTEVRNHMEYENSRVFTYVESLLRGEKNPDYNIKIFAGKHHHIETRLKELKDIIIRYYPQQSSDRLNATLFDIINCEQDLKSHCLVEDRIFVPVVEKVEHIAETVIQYNNDSGDNSHPNESDSLSPREKEIVGCVARGMSNKEIADTLCVSINTVTTHRRNIATKLGIHSPVGLAIYAIVNKMVDINNLHLE
ncbi:MAG: helix-turn-helix transcriptional regulator [Muribaculaceae bacterium]|nr:helix-turn-helix transcriptional regulator [Muribaculaceae bacterium]